MLQSAAGRRLEALRWNFVTVLVMPPGGALWQCLLLPLVVLYYTGQVKRQLMSVW